MIFNIWVTRQCNLKCTYCYEGQEKLDKKLDNNTVQKVIKFIVQKTNEKKDSFISVNFHGGEPLIAFDIVQYIVIELEKRLSTVKINYGLTTNGTLLDDDIIEFLAQAMPLGLTLSVDGNEGVHNRNRKLANGRGSYELVDQYLEKIIKQIPECRARATYTHNTVNDLSKSVIHLIQKGFKTIVAAGDYYDPFWQDEDENILRREIHKLHDYYQAMQNKEKVRVNLLDKSLTEYLPCQGGISSVNIDVDGKLYPCIAAVGNSDYQIGDIECGIDKIKVANILDMGSAMHEECKECPINKHCNGVRCKLKNKIMSGNCLDIPVFLCVEKNAIYDS